MSESALADALRNLPDVGQLVKDRGYRQVWRFEFGGRAYFLKWYPRDAAPAVKRLVVGNPAMREFAKLLALQKARIPSPRAVAVLKGFKIRQRQGDAVILEAIEPSIQLDRYLNDCDLAGGHVPDRRKLVDQLIELVYLLGRSKLGHDDLHLGNVLLADGRLHLLDGYAVDSGGLKLRHVMMLGHAASRWATRADLVRGWRVLRATESPPPATNPVSPRLHRKFLRRTLGENPYFGRISVDGWQGHFVKGLKLPRWWAPASGLRVSADDWHRQWPTLSRLIAEADVLKRSRSGDVLGTTLQLGGRAVEVVVKRPRRKTLWRQINAFGRPGKARRSWVKAWKLAIRNFPVEWPLLFVERRTLGYVTHSMLIVARIPGRTLADQDLDAMPPEDRRTLFRRVGRTLRRLERHGFSHCDAKSSNWIVVADPNRGPVPLIIDVDGIRHYRWDGAGIERVLRSMKEHPQYTREDSRNLCLGYAPFARVVEEEPGADAVEGHQR